MATGDFVYNIGETGKFFLNPIQELAYSTWGAVFNVLGAILLLLIGYVLAGAIGFIVTFLLDKIGVNRYLQRAQLTKVIGHTNVPNVLGEVTKWYIFIGVFLKQAALNLKFGALSTLLVDFAEWVPKVIAAILVFYALLALANIVQAKVVEHSKMKGVKTVANVLKGSILVIAFVIGLDQIGIDVQIVENLILIVVAGIAVGFALAVGVGLGLGLKKEGESLVNTIKKSL